MATEKTTPSAKNYLGHPCSIASALERFADPLKQSKANNFDSRELAQKVGRELALLMERCDSALSVTVLAMEKAAENDDTELEALLTVQAEFALRTSNDFFKFTGLVLDALERGDLVKPAQAEEVAHG